MDIANLRNGIYNIDNFDIFCLKCNKIIEEMKKNDDLCNLEISGIAISLIGEISKKLFSKHISNKFSYVISKMEGDKSNGVKIEEYASMCGLSSGHFLSFSRKNTE